MLQAVGGTYLVLILASTSLSKLRHLRAVALDVSRSAVVDPAVGLLLVVGVCVVELVLAVLICLARGPGRVGAVLVLLFLSFAVYRIAVQLRSGVVSCECAGPARRERGELQDALLRSIPSVLLALLAVSWTIGMQHGGPSPRWLPWAGLAVPVIALLVGVARSGLPRADTDAVSGQPLQSTGEAVT